MNVKIKFAVYKVVLCLAIFSLCACEHPTKTQNQAVSSQDTAWKIGAKIHFEENSGGGYIGLKEINKTTKSILKSVLKIKEDSCTDNAKVLLKKEDGEIKLSHYVEKITPNVGEELHATLLYTRPRSSHNSETFSQVCGVLFKNCKTPPKIETVAEKYNEIIKPSLHFKISGIALVKNEGGSYIVAKLLSNGHESIYNGDKSISAWLHMTLVNCVDDSILANPAIVDQIVKKLNQKLQGKEIKIAAKHGVADLEFGLSGNYWRIRALKKVEFLRPPL